MGTVAQSRKRKKKNFTEKKKNTATKDTKQSECINGSKRKTLQVKHANNHHN